MFDHRVVVIGDPKTAADQLPSIHRVFSLFKRVMLGTYHGPWSKKWAAMYCEEFVFRFNRRTAAVRTQFVRRILEEGARRPSRVRKFAGERFDGELRPVAA